MLIRILLHIHVAVGTPHRTQPQAIMSVHNNLALDCAAITIGPVHGMQHATCNMQHATCNQNVAGLLLQARLLHAYAYMHVYVCMHIYKLSLVHAYIHTCTLVLYMHAHVHAA